MSDDTINGKTTTLEGTPILDEGAEAQVAALDPIEPFREALRRDDPEYAAEHPAPDVVKKQRGMATLHISLDREQRVFEINVREPGIVRGAAIHIEQPKVFAGGLRNVQLVQPVLLIECDPELDVRTRRFMWVSSDEIIRTNPGIEAQWRATAIAAPHIRHLFELVQVPS